MLWRTPRHRRVSRRTWGACLLLMVAAGALPAAPSRAAGEEVIGLVKRVQGAAFVVRAGVQLTATPGTPIHRTDTLRTGSDGSIGVTFTDQTRLSLGSDAEARIEEFEFSEERRDGVFVTRLVKGSLEYISGLIAKYSPEASTLKTRYGNIGVRGTHFFVVLAPEEGRPSPP